MQEFQSSTSAVVRAFALRSVDLSLIPIMGYLSKTLKMPCTVSLLDAKHERVCVEKRPAGLLAFYYSSTCKILLLWELKLGHS